MISQLDRAAVRGGSSRAGLRRPTDLVRAEQRVSDADAEFEAALRTGVPMLLLVARDQELALATAARDALAAVS